ncbi:L,D-transpeptidase [Bosea sp. (in: a-proteobacteria)]|uniref:L,D-transpeptidase n=1 Tax=Bosea sp. (in: a-proteobacteria) TaxID=1871050 RepID=UPI00121BEC61|nr:L,D-transpeptidase [Bosea sp. (in: a-proteobacteria)]TAJ31241.1 MAG: murein L,D-transpeptidase [Bosea sp. (in: a-proteobacteria)]
MRRVLGLLAVLFLSFGAITTAKAGVDVKVDIAAQRMSVTTSDGEVYNWAISSGRQGFRSPNGVYRPTRLEKNWYSRKYGGAMPHAVFFRGGYAIHGTGAVGALGRPASHGCIRLHPANAAKLFALVKKHGAAQTRIALNGSAPDNHSRFAKATPAGKAKLAKLRSKATVAVATRGEPRLGVAKVSKAKLAKAKTQRHHALGAAQQQRGAGWEAARGQIMLRPALPAGAYGYQPYYPAGYGYGSGWR